MNNIKFRCWCPKTKRMFRVESLSFDDNGKIECIEGKSLSNQEACTIWKNETFELLQFTGLLDLGNNEVYTGDIVKVQTGYDEDDLSWDIFVVEFANGLFRLNTYGDSLDNDNLNDYIIDFDDVCDVEIIGNKFENPELLNNI